MTLLLALVSRPSDTWFSRLAQGQASARRTTRRWTTPVYSCSPVRRQRKDCPVGSVKSSRTSDGGAPSGSQLRCNKTFGP